MSEWKEVTIDEITSKLGDGLHGTPKYSDDGEYYFVNGNNLHEGRIVVDDKTKRVSVEEFEKYKKELNERTLFVSINGTLGNVAYYNNEKIVLGKSACYFNVKPEVNIDYVRYVLESRHFKYYIDKFSSGTTIQNLSLKAMREFPFMLPEIEVQKEIAQTLSNLDKKITLLRQQNQTLEDLAQTLFKRWFVEFEFPNDNGEPYLSSGGKMKASEFGEIPFGWKVGKLKNIATLNDKQVSKKDNTETIKYIDTGSLTKGVISEIKTLNYNEAPSRAKRRVKTNSILYSIVRPTQCHYGILKSIESNYIASTGFCVIDSVNHPHYLYLLLTQQRTIDYFESIANATASTYPTMRQEDIGNLEIIIPDDSTLSCFEKVADNCWQTIDNNNKEIQTLTQLRDTLLPKLMSGELRIKQEAITN